MNSTSIVRALACAFALTSTAALADGASRGSIKDAPIVQSSNWTGLYVGGNLGSAWTSSDATFANLPAPIVGGGDGRYNLDGSSFVGGIHAGYNFQASQFVYGIEGDVSWLGDSRRTRGIAISSALFPGFSETISSETDWVATVRARLGISMGSVLAYATAGVAWGDVKHGYVATQTGVGAARFALDRNTTQNGWTVGGGLEWAAGRNWILRGEYLHVDLGSARLATPNNAASSPTSTKFENSLDIVRAGISYKF